MELIELLTLQWLRKVVCHHVSLGTILNVQLISFDSVSDELISDGNVTCPFTAGLLVVFLEQNCTLVVLIYDFFFGVVSLPIQEVVRPQNLSFYCWTSYHFFSSIITLLLS